jgi:acetone carboxylase gamma subunit
MKEVKSWSATLVSMPGKSGRVIACRACSAELCGTDASWKEHAVLRESPLREAAGATYRSAGDEVLLRRFYCGSCGAALDSEIALPGEPFLLDRLAE